MFIRLLIADDHELVREGLRQTFNGSDITVVGEAATPAEALRLALEQVVHVVLLDISWADGGRTRDNGFEVLSQIKSTKPDVSVLIYSRHDREPYISRCRDLGASGYLVKGVDKQALLAAVRNAYVGKDVWDKASEEV